MVVDEAQLKEYFGEDWEYLKETLGIISSRGVFRLLRQQNWGAVADSLDSSEDPKALAERILEKRVENRVLLTLDETFAPTTKKE